MHRLKQRVSKWLIAVFVISLLIPSSIMEQTIQAQTTVNLALNKSVTRSSDASAGRATSAVDGNYSTYWMPLSTDRTDKNVWLRVDLGTSQVFNKVVLNFATLNTAAYKIQYSDDDATWKDAFSKTGGISTTETPNFNLVSGRYVKLDIALSNTNNYQMNEFEIYNAGVQQAVLDNVYFADTADHVFPLNDTIQLSTYTTKQLNVKGTLTDGTSADLTNASVTLQSSNLVVASIDQTGQIAGIKDGVTKINGAVTLNNITKNTTVWVAVYDPAVLTADIQLSHPTMTTAIGQPCILNPGDPFPVVQIHPYSDAVISGELIYNVSNAVYQLPTMQLLSGIDQQIQFPGTVGQIGQYEIRLKLIAAGGQPLYDAFYFTVLDPAAVQTDQSKIVYLGADGKLVYVSDYKGNQVIDFSGSGYMGGGAKIPDVQAKVVLTPVDGDDTLSVQNAIDQVSQMPLAANGIRGAVVLKKGTYEIGGTLYIKASGVVLRGEGQGLDGTILYATGATVRNILVIGGAKGPQITSTGKSTITDLFVPSGARSFHVDDVRLFKVGDNVMVRRHGNQRWIHNISMDQIMDRPGTTGETVQWTPFDLDFDRVITSIDSNIITVDAPIANSIEQRWGGGELLKYDNSARIQQVGVENMRVDSEFDPSIISTTVDSNSKGTAPYYADENHAQSFAVFNSVENAWIREITGYHLVYSLVDVEDNSKWITVQDNKMFDMVSIITGERRYTYKMSGQLALMQRNYAETARHAFIVDSRVKGPNVFLDSEAITNYNTSEPHHRWSVGGLYDNVKAPIAIQDRGWDGSGHGWAGANYVTWNTEGQLTAQQPPTAQTYAIGHVGTKKNGSLPNSYDTRPRQDAYWDQFGKHVNPRSLYLQQLQDRSGSAALQNIIQTPVGGGSLDMLLSSNANLSGITIDGGTSLNEPFAADTTSYTATVANNVTSIAVTPTVEDSTASVTINGTVVTSGQASAAIHLNAGENPIQIVVTAQDGTTQKTYTTTVTRLFSSNANLSGITLGEGTSLNEPFAPDTTSYTAAVKHNVFSLTVTPTREDRSATVMVDGILVTNDQLSAEIKLNKGANPIQIAVTAQDSTTKKTYTVTVKHPGNTDNEKQDDDKKQKDNER